MTDKPVELPDDLIEMGEAGRLVNRTRQAIWHAIKRGDLTGWRIGRQHRVSRSEVLGHYVQVSPRRTDTDAA